TSPIAAAGRDLAAKPRERYRRSPCDYAARLRRRPHDHARRAQLLTRRRADRVPAQRKQTDLASQDLDFADRRRASRSARAAVARGLSGSADLVSRWAMDRLYRVDRP